MTNPLHVGCWITLIPRHRLSREGLCWWPDPRSDRGAVPHALVPKKRLCHKASCIPWISIHFCGDRMVSLIRIRPEYVLVYLKDTPHVLSVYVK